MVRILHFHLTMTSSQERIRKLRQEVESLRNLLERTRSKQKSKTQDTTPPSKQKRLPRPKKEDDIPSF